MTDVGGEGSGLIVDSPYEVANWRPLVNWILAIPHLIVLSVLGYVTQILVVIYWLIFLVTGKLNRGLYGFMSMNLRYTARGYGFVYGFSEQYPPFEFPTQAADDGGYPPVRLELPEAPETQPRTAAANFILAIPHYIVLAVYGIGVSVVLLIAWFAVLFTGRWPEGMRDFVVRFGNYAIRVWRYAVMVDTSYPSFALD